MRAFRRVSEGLACGLDDWERELLARLALEVRALLQADDPAHEMKLSMWTTSYLR